MIYIKNNARYSWPSDTKCLIYTWFKFELALFISCFKLFFSMHQITFFSSYWWIQYFDNTNPHCLNGFEFDRLLSRYEEKQMLVLFITTFDLMAGIFSNILFLSFAFPFKPQFGLYTALPLNEPMWKQSFRCHQKKTGLCLKSLLL